LKVPLPHATSRTLTCLSPKAARSREYPRSRPFGSLVRRAVIASVLGAVLPGFVPIDNSQATNPIEISKVALKDYVDQFSHAFAAKIGDYKAALRLPTSSSAQDGPLKEAERSGDHVLQSVVTEAANRFGVPERWIRATIIVESAGERGATSPVGAMGLMQVMPDTYAYLRDRFGLGGDPYAMRDNVLAGSAYLREMYDRYGSPGFIAAYNAGPQRYDEYLRNGRSLPDETKHYVVAVGSALGQDFSGSVLGELGGNARFGPPIVISQSGDLFLGHVGQPPTMGARLALHSLLSRAIGLAN
jgi:soluble lytic murein transglycosylase-like protein